MRTFLVVYTYALPYGQGVSNRSFKLAEGKKLNETTLSEISDALTQQQGTPIVITNIIPLES